MPLKILIVLTLLGAGRGLAEQSLASMNLHDAHQAINGEKEFSARKYEQAYDTYSKLVESARDPGLATAEARAAVAFGLQEGKYEQGLERARRCRSALFVSGADEVDGCQRGLSEVA